MTGGFLLDKSALARWSTPRIGAVLDPLASTRQLFTCAVIELEVRYSARSPREYKAMTRDRSQTYQWVEITSGAQALALEWQAVLARKSQLRAVGIAALLIAATASVHGLTVLHYDQDYELLGRLCNAPHGYVVPPGSVD